jgi:hypothetical protein
MVWRFQTFRKWFWRNGMEVSDCPEMILTEWYGGSSRLSGNDSDGMVWRFQTVRKCPWRNGMEVPDCQEMILTEWYGGTRLSGNDSDGMVWMFQTVRKRFVLGIWSTQWLQCVGTKNEPWCGNKCYIS